jgi:hypothetical protein
LRGEDLKTFNFFVNVELGEDEVEVMPLLMCKGNFVAEPALWLEYAAEEAKPTFDAFVKHKQNVNFVVSLYLFFVLMGCACF